jgi:hypothetical protein
LDADTPPQGVKIARRNTTDPQQRENPAKLVSEQAAELKLAIDLKETKTLVRTLVELPQTTGTRSLIARS